MTESARGLTIENRRQAGQSDAPPFVLPAPLLGGANGRYSRQARRRSGGPGRPKRREEGKPLPRGKKPGSLCFGYACAPLARQRAGLLILRKERHDGRIMVKPFASLFSTRTAPAGPVAWLLVGLGNPGPEYENTRHNAGFMAVEELARQMDCKIDRLKYKSLCGDGMLQGERVLLMKPSTFMNRSGQAVTEAMRFYKIPPERVLVFSDDISLEPGRLRVRRSGSDGGHNGLKDIIYLTGSDQFPRVRIGVGAKPRPDYDLAKWVLGHFSQEEYQKLTQALERAADAAGLIVQGQIGEAMNRYNGK